MLKKRKIILGIAAMIVGFGLVLWTMSPNAEPSYQGKSLKGWAQQYGTNHWSGIDREASWQAEAAIQAIGTNAIPFLLERMRARDSFVKQRLCRLLPPKWHGPLHLKDNSSGTRHVGAYGLAALGTNAPSAVPTLIDIASHHPDPDGRYLAVFTLRTLGPASEPAIPFLIQCLTNKVDIIRDDAALGLGTIGRQPEVCVPALVQYLEIAKTSARGYERRDAIDALSRFGTNAEAATSTILELLADADQNTRQYVTNCLPLINPEAAAKVFPQSPQ